MVKHKFIIEFDTDTENVFIKKHIDDIYKNQMIRCIKCGKEYKYYSFNYHKKTCKGDCGNGGNNGNEEKPNSEYVEVVNDDKTNAEYYAYAQYE